MLRTVPPVRSPLTPRALLGAARGPLPFGDDPRDVLARKLATDYDADGVTLNASGTHALRIALETAAAITPGGAALLPAYTCYEVATAAVGARIPVALYDVDPDTLQPDWDSLARAGDRRVAAVVVAPLHGMTIDWERARSLADGMGALLIEDAAQAQGATWRGRPVGCLGDATVLSFGRGKGWTGAGGGALLRRGGTAEHRAADNAAASSRPGRRGTAAELRTLVAAGAQWLLSDPLLFALPASLPFLHLGETLYHAPTPPASMTRASALLILGAAGQAAAEVEARRRAAAAYSAALGEPATDERGSAGWLRYPLRLRGGWGATRGTEMVRLGAGPGYPTTLRELPALAPLLQEPALPLPGADALVAELVTLPTHARARASDRERLIELARPRLVARAAPGVASSGRVASSQRTGSVQRAGSEA